MESRDVYYKMLIFNLILTTSAIFSINSSRPELSSCRFNHAKGVPSKRACAADGQEFIVITYATDTSNWEDWQRGYRLGVILILPPPDVSREVNSLRARYDPRSAASCPAHISLSDPLSSEMSSALAEEVRGALADVLPFELHYDRLYASTRHAGVSYRITPREPIGRLKQALHCTSGFADEAHRRRGIAPHMTIAEFISIDESLKLCARLQDTAPVGSFLCDRLEYMVPDDGFRFQRRLTFPLGDSE